ncbi:MAG: alkaline shock response membrane anchor protein AmaP [Candidatus Omnitrophota bacterium]|jgi:uncharacterized alkaline shock family protein YloU
MRFFNSLGIVFYATVLIIIGAGLIVYSFNLLQPAQISDVLVYLQSGLNTRLIVGLSGLLLILISFSFAQLILGRFQSEKTIAFTTPSGEVTVALSAVEDLIRRIAALLPEIRELRPDVIAGKKGLMVDLRVILRSEANIPELTARLQDLTKSKIQSALGIEEQINIRIHIAKIITSEEKDKKRKSQSVAEPMEQQAGLPYGGYGRL